MELGNRVEAPDDATDARARIAVLSTDELLLGALRTAAPGLAILDAASVGDLARLLGSHRCRALCVDLASVGRSGLDLVPRLEALFPELPLVVVASRDDEPTVELMLARGVAERFLMKPIAPHRARTVLTEVARLGHERIVGPAPGLAPPPPPPPPPEPRARQLAAAARAEQAAPAAARFSFARAWPTRPTVPAAIIAAILLFGTLATIALLPNGERAAPSATVDRQQARLATPPGPRGTDAELATLLAAGDLALARGALVAPIGASAMDYYRRAASLDPSNRAARTGLSATAEALLRDAETALNGRRYVEAETQARAASLVLPGEPRIADLLDRVQQSQRRGGRAPATGASPPESRGSPAPRAVPPKTPAAAAALAATTPPTRAGAGSTPAIGTNSSRGTGPATTAAGSELPEGAGASGPAAPAAQTDGSAPDVSTPGGTPPAGAAADARPSATSAATLLRRVAGSDPRYPRRARTDGVTGWVDVEFTVDADGSARDVRVVRAQPQRVFDDAARRAVSTWRYAPPGEPRRASVRLRFDLED